MSRYAKATICQRSNRFPSVALYESSRIRGPERFDLQNFLLKQLRFPSEIRRGEHVAEFWSHLVPKDAWWEAFELLRERSFAGAFIVDDATDDSFLAMCQKMVGKDFKATGGIAIRFTNLLTGRPLIRLTVVGIYNSTRQVFNGNDGPHIVLPDEMDQRIVDDPTRPPIGWGIVAKALKVRRKLKQELAPAPELVDLVMV